MVIYPLQAKFHYIPLKPHKAHAWFGGVKASVKSMACYCRLHSLQRSGVLNIPGADAAQKGKTILLRVILASVMLGLISAASGWELVYISMTGSLHLCLHLHLSHTYSDRWKGLFNSLLNSTYSQKHLQRQSGTFHTEWWIWWYVIIHFYMEHITHVLLMWSSIGIKWCIVLLLKIPL